MINSVVIGNGIVGQATRKTFGIKDYFDLKGSTLSLKQIAERKKYIFYCLPTPTIKGKQDREALIQIIKQISEYGGGHIHIIRSTVLPGTNNYIKEKLGIKNIVSNPEFLTEATWEQDSLHPDIVVLGADQPNYAKDVEALYRSRFKGGQIFTTDSITAELIKYAVNTFYSTKVIFANQLYDIAKTCGGNYEKIKEVMYARKWIGENHLDVHHAGYRGYAGKCLPKDMSALAEMSGNRLLKLIQKINTEYNGHKE